MKCYDGLIYDLLQHKPSLQFIYNFQTGIPTLKDPGL